MIKFLQQTVLALGLTAGISLSAYAEPPEGGALQHGPGPAAELPPSPGGFGPFGGPGGPGPFGPPGAFGPHGLPGAPGLMPELAPPPFLHELDLSEAQQDKVFAILLANAPLIHEQEKLAHKSGKELHALLEQDQYDEAKIKSLAEAQAHATAQLLVLHARGVHQILALLTPEQKAKLDAMKEKFAGPHAQHGDGPHGDGQHGDAH